MAFDGIAIAGLVSEFQEALAGGRITKIAQTEADKLLLTVKSSNADENGKTVRTQNRLVISVNPSLPLLYLTKQNEASPLQAPTFCMVLRKHLNNCKIQSVRQIGLERVICFELEHLNEMGDYCRKRLYVELMGKHSNIIFCDENDKIIDSIKHITPMVSSVREVLPGREYFIPNTQGKSDPFQITQEEFFDTVFGKPLPLDKAIYSSLTGFSSVMANELIYRASLADRRQACELSEMEKLHLYRNFLGLTESIKKKEFVPCIIFRNGTPIEFSGVLLKEYSENDMYQTERRATMSEVLYEYYNTKETLGRIRQKSADLRRITQTVLERCLKKHDLQEKQLKDTAKREKYKVYGELLTTYGYALEGGEKSLTCDNYYTNTEITIPLDPEKTALENAKRYFDKYAKLKRTYEALSVQIQETKEEISHLYSISNSLDIARGEEDLLAIRRELAESGYIRRHAAKGKQSSRKNEKSKPLHYLSSDGFHMYVGKNNYQNDELTFKVASGNDWWFHAKQNAGSHVIVRTEGKELPDRTFEEAARLAAFYSKSRGQEKAEIDYVQKKQIKKPNGAKPGFVVYYTNYSMTVPTDIEGIEEVPEQGH